MVKEYHTSLLEGPPEPTKRNPAIIIKTQLLTPSDVAELLQISVRTVYDHARRLGGFYPAGIKVLRFRPEVIYGSVEGQGNAVMDIYGQPLRQERHL